MAALADPSELQNKLASLKRTPVPPVPAGKNNPLNNVKLKPTVPLKPKHGESSENNNRKERSPSVREKITLLQGGAVPETKPKPKIPLKQPPVKDDHVKNGKNAPRPPSVIDKPSPVIVSESRGTSVPEEAPLPPAFTLGDPPTKPTKLRLWALRQSLQKYTGTTHPPRPTLPSTTTEQNGDEEADAPPVPVKPKPRDVITSNGIKHKPAPPNKNDDIYDDTVPDEDFYDDNVAENAAATNSSDDIYDDTVETGGKDEDFYDDNVGEDDQTFGQDLYEPLEELQGAQELNGVTRNESAPPALPDKTSKDQVKEEKKKREKEQKEKKKKEKEEKEKEEKEKKNQKKEKDRKISEMKKKFSVRGNERSIGTCSAAVDVRGNKMEISATIGETFDIIRKDKPSPENKWLVRNKVGEYGFIDINNIEGHQSEDIGEDLYEDVAAVQQSVHNMAEDFASAPTTSPPPPPNRNPGSDNQEVYDDVATGNQEIYDDVAAEGDGDEMYEPL